MQNNVAQGCSAFTFTLTNWWWSELALSLWSLGDSIMTQQKVPTQKDSEEHRGVSQPIPSHLTFSAQTL